jgi:hypothetical protein
MAGNPNDGTGGIASLLSEVMAGLGRLLKGELALARAEATENVKAAGAGIAKIAVGLVVALVGLNVLAGAAVAGLAATGMGPAWASLIVGAVLCAVALALVFAGKAALRLHGLWPDRTLRGLRRDAEAVQAGLQDPGVQGSGLQDRGARHV